ncbi:MAG: transaldolase family protein [Bryobacteraceae bacterium]
MSESVIERLMKTNPSMEVWWDSSPLVFEKWAAKMVAAAPEAKKDEMAAQVGRLFVTSDPASSVFRGCTTNPPLSLTAVKSDPKYWDARIDEIIAANPGISQNQLFWKTYKTVIQKGAEMMLPIWEASGGRYGFVSGQLDPRLFTETEIMFQQADEIAALGKNIMVKVPASQQGPDVVRYLTSKGISTNVTTCFTVPQIMEVARAAREGLEIAKKNKVDMSRWRAVITHMLARLIERPELMKQAEHYKVEVTEADRKWFGIAVFKRACQLIWEGGYPSKMLLCSVRPGPYVAGKTRYWDIEEMAGADVVFTLPPVALEPLFQLDEDLIFDPEAIHRPVPAASLEKMLKLPYCMQAYEPHGLSPDQFNTHPATVYTVNEFSKASAGLEEYVGQRLALAGARA